MGRVRDERRIISAGIIYTVECNSGLGVLVVVEFSFVRNDVCSSCQERREKELKKVT